LGAGAGAGAGFAAGAGVPFSGSFFFLEADSLSLT
jgi:H+/Cl- antiporter ClcA